MRNDNARWDHPSQDALIHKDASLQVQQIWPKRQVLISGAQVFDVIDVPLISWQSEEALEAYAIVLRRDRVLEINGPARSEGWDDVQNIAVSDMTDGYAVFEISGVGALDLLKHGGFIQPELSSRSASRLLFGFPALLYRRSGGRFILHVSSPLAEAMRKMLCSHLSP